MNRQKSLDVLQYNQFEAQRQSDRKKQERIKQQEEDKAYIDKINSELYQERNSNILKKQSVIDQSQRDYISYMNNKQHETKDVQGSFRKRNSKLMELNTFKIGGEVREIKRKNYQDYNDNLNLNPTKNYPVSKTNEMNIINNISERKPINLNAFNIISNQPNKEFNENPKLYTTSDQKIAMNKENYDQYGRQIGNKIDNNNYNEQVHHPETIKGIENLENYSAFNDHYNYRPPSGNNTQNKSNDQYQKNTGYVADRQISKNEYQPIHYEQNKIDQIDQNQHYYQNQNDSYQNQPKQPSVSTVPQGKGKKVDLNSIPIPDNVRNVEDYEKYLVQLGIDPISLEYVDSSSNQNSYQEDRFLEDKMKNLNINDNHYEMNMHNEKQSQNPYHEERLHQQQGEYYQQKPQSQPQSYNQSQSNNQQEMFVPRQQYKNQSQILLADASAHQRNKPEEPKRDYEPLSKVKPVVINPYSTKNYDFGGTNLSHNPITNPVNSTNFVVGKNYYRNTGSLMS